MGGYIERGSLRGGFGRGIFRALREEFRALVDDWAGERECWICPIGFEIGIVGGCVFCQGFRAAVDRNRQFGTGLVDDNDIVVVPDNT